MFGFFTITLSITRIKTVFLQIEPNFKCEFGKNISIGDVIYINFGCIILDCVNITIGCHISNEPNFALYAAKYSIYPEERIVGGYYGKLITIEDNVWIGVTIDEGIVIGVGSVVTKNIPSRVVTAGNPCKIIRKITEKDKSRYLESLKHELKYYNLI
ncbi:trimeric LpxA-like protein [Neocallimastix lanati (nom. inval.)]|nr:trimeric LpxA-like protein [Neocallimastix sp. JGI-2020a]